MTPLLLLRALIPTWRFFDRPGEEARLLFRTERGAGTWGPWVDAQLPAPPRGVMSLFHNPGDLAQLALYNLLERCLSDIEDADTPEQFHRSASYELLQNWISAQATPGIRYQFRLVTVVPGAPLESATEHLLSTVHGGGAPA